MTLACRRLKVKVMGLVSAVGLTLVEGSLFSIITLFEITQNAGAAAGGVDMNVSEQRSAS